jgi:hypothetical protein
MVLLLALILGVLGMHALVMPPMTMSADITRTTVTDTIPAPTVTGDAHVTPTSAPANGAEPHATAMTASGQAVSAMAASEGTASSAAVTIAQAGSDPTSPMPDHGMAHMCLAVLAAALALALAAALLTAVSHQVGASTHRAPGLVRTAPRRPPPDHAVRLAELCVLRN